MADDYPTFAEFADEHILEGEKKRLDDILNVPLLIIAFKVGKSKFKDDSYLTLQIKINEDTFVVFTGSHVLKDQAERYEDKMPFYTTIIKPGQYYTMS